jgi:hypothetical protein
MPLAALTAMLRAVGHHQRILGADICGEYSPPRHANLLKRIESKFDQPLHSVTDPRRIDDNRRTDVELARTLFEACLTTATP